MRRYLVEILASISLIALVAGGAVFAAYGSDDTSPAPARSIGLDLAPGTFELGVQDDQLPVGDARRVRWGLEQLDRATRLTRLDLIWEFVEPAEGEWDFARYDRILEGMANRGIRAIIDVHTPPAWAKSPTGLDVGAYGEMLERFLCRPAASRAVVALEPWNEPNIGFFLRPQWGRDADGRWEPRSPEIYAALVRAADRAKQRCRPGLPLMGPALAATGSAAPRGGVGVLEFLQALPQGLPLDILSQHLYLANSPEDSRSMPSYRRMEDLLEVADRTFGSALPVVISETGFLTGETPYHSTVVSLAEQSDRLEASVDLARRHPRIRVLIYFNLEDNPNWPAGLWRLRGPAKPAWNTFLQLQRRQGLPGG